MFPVHLLHPVCSVIVWKECDHQSLTSCFIMSNTVGENNDLFTGSLNESKDWQHRERAEWLIKQNNEKNINSLVSSSFYLLTRVCCPLGPALLSVVVETQTSDPDRQTAIPPGPAPTLSPGPIAAMVLLHTVRGLSTVSRLPAHKTPGTTWESNKSNDLCTSAVLIKGALP